MATQSDLVAVRNGPNRLRQGLILTSAVATGVAGAIIVALIPLLVKMLVEHRGMTVVDSGDVVSLRMLGGTVGSILVVLATFRFSWRWIAGLSLLVVLVGNFMSALVHDASALIFAQVLTGLGEGGTIIVGAAIAVTRNPDRGYGIYLAATIVLSAALFHVVPLLSSTYGLLSLLGVMSLIAFVAFLLVPWFPDHKGTQLELEKPVSKHGLMSVMALTSLAAVGLFYVGIATVWSCIEQIGTQTGGPEHQVESAIGNIYLAMGICGSLVSIVCGDRFGQRLPLVVACSIATMSMLLIAGPTWGMFLAGVTALVFSWMMAFPYLMGLVAHVDPSGRLAGISLVVQMICFTAGPSLGTRLLTSNLDWLTELVVASFILTAVAVWVATQPNRGSLPAAQTL